MSIVVIWLVIAVVPVPVVSTEIAPASATIDHSAFPARNVTAISNIIVVVEVCNWVAVVVCRLEIAIVPIPAVITVVAPASILVANSILPSMNVSLVIVARLCMVSDDI